jgi:hypothetical protein
MINASHTGISLAQQASNTLASSKQTRSDFDALGKALQSGDLSAAQNALTSFEADVPGFQPTHSPGATKVSQAHRPQDANAKPTNSSQPLPATPMALADLEQALSAKDMTAANRGLLNASF